MHLDTAGVGHACQSRSSGRLPIFTPENIDGGDLRQVTWQDEAELR